MKSKTRPAARRIAAVAAFALAVASTGAASASAATTTPVRSAVTVVQPMQLPPPDGGGYYPSATCDAWNDGQRIAGADGQIWVCTNEGSWWYWAPTGEYIV